VADLYNILFDAVLSPSSLDTLGHGRDGFYFGANEEHTLYDVGKAIAENLVSAGKGKDSEPTTFTKEEIDKYFGVRIIRFFCHSFPDPLMLLNLFRGATTLDLILAVGRQEVEPWDGLQNGRPKICWPVSRQRWKQRSRKGGRLKPRGYEIHIRTRVSITSRMSRK